MAEVPEKAVTKARELWTGLYAIVIATSSFTIYSTSIY